jgi:hypothetical protein
MQLELMGSGGGAEAGAAADGIPPRVDGRGASLLPGTESVSSSSEELVALPAIVQQQLRRSLLFGTDGGAPLRLFASSATAAAFSAAYLASLFFDALRHDSLPLPLVWTLLRWETLVIMALVGLLVTECAMILATTMCRHGVEGGTDSAAFLQTLLGGSVPRAVEAKVTRRRKMSLLQAVVPVGSCFLVPLRAALTGAVELTDGVLAAYGVLIVCFLPIVSIGAGWLLFLHVPVIVVCDRISRIAAGIHASSASGRPVNFDAIMRSIVSAHELQQRCATTLRYSNNQPLPLPATCAMHLLLLMLLLCAGCWAQALGPSRTASPDDLLPLGHGRLASVLDDRRAAGRRRCNPVAPTLGLRVRRRVVVVWVCVAAPRGGGDEQRVQPVGVRDFWPALQDATTAATGRRRHRSQRVTSPIIRWDGRINPSIGWRWRVGVRPWHAQQQQQQQQRACASARVRSRPCSDRWSPEVRGWAQSRARDRLCIPREAD